MEVLNKSCSKCRKEKLIEEFKLVKDKPRVDRSIVYYHSGTCIECMYKRKSELYHANMEALRSNRFCEQCNQELPASKSLAARFCDHLCVAKWRYNNDDEYRKKKKAANKEWAKNNPHSNRESVIKYRGSTHGKLSRQVTCENRRAAKAGGKITNEEWFSLVDFTGLLCLRCGNDKKIEMDHVVPLKLDGEHNIFNVQPLCKKHNCEKSIATDDFRSSELMEYLYDRFGRTLTT